jgi:outer membrane receptor for ferrienterochelin and colicin
MSFLKTLLATLLVAVAVATPAFGQGNPTGNISGKVVDPAGLMLPGVTVTATSPALQGVKTTVTSENGDYMIPFLPPGDYTVTFQLSGFQPSQRSVVVVIGETLTVDMRLGLATVSETVEVVGTASTEIAPGLTVASTYKAETLELLPVGRTLNAAALLAPGVQDNGPGGNIMISGAMSFDSQFLINGVVVNENLRGQAVLAFVEDAIQETKVSVGSLSAEFGRFQGGVVNTITKSGGNRFSGSFRTSFTNDSWRALTPYPGDATIDKTVPTYEVTGGGPVLRDRLWFFAAGRFENSEENRTLPYTAYNYVLANDEKRYEGKLTYALNQGNTFKGAYSKRRLDTLNNSFGTVIDAKTFYDNANEDILSSFNYTGVITSKWFVEAQYSNREKNYIGSGATTQDQYAGTPIWDRSRGQARFNSPTFCSVCGSGLEQRDNWNTLVKTNYFLSTEKTGSHNLVGGFDVYKEMRKNDNYQSGSSYRVQATSAILQGSDVYPVFRTGNTTYVEYLPLVEPTQGNDIRTYSYFANDTWRLNNTITLNLGLRYDRNRSKDQAGQQVVEDSAWSPRLGATWDVRGDGNWVANGGFARYVAGISTAIVDAGSAGGRTATFSYFYGGPNVNTEAGQPLLTSEEALKVLFDWFFANGGLNRTTRNAPSIPGVTVKVGDGLKAPNSNEYMVGITRQLGSRGTARVDYLYREFSDFYGDFRDMSTGKVTDPTGRVYDLTVVDNTDLANRTYKGLSFQTSYRFGSDLQVGGNYTLSWLRGNFEGEDTGSGPVRFSGNDQPEYRGEWNYPTGYLNDQRHKVRAWFNYELPFGDRFGRWNVGMVQRVDTSDASSADATIDVRPFVTNPGYQSVPSTVTYYFGPRGDQRYDSLYGTDLSLNWTVPLNALGRTQLFFRGVVLNLFNNAAILSGDETIYTSTNNPNNFPYQTFNPWTTTPQVGVNYDFGPNYGQPTGTGSYQAPREFNFSVGIRF